MIKSYLSSLVDAWNRFWFTPADPAILSLMRVLVGSMILYTHFVWTFELEAFFSNSNAILPAELRELSLGPGNWAWSHFDWIGRSSFTLQLVHFGGLLIVLAFTLGVFTRVTGALSALLVISYANRATGVQFGLDQINEFLCLYLVIGNSGARFSIDQWWAQRNAEREQGRGVVANCPAVDSWSRISIRLIQVHMCVVYLFAGLGKLQGDTWWNGSAIWFSLASYEYQSLDMTWLAHHLWLVNLLTLVAVAWEVSYAFMIWNRLARPVYLCIAVFIHLGIGLAMGMLTFGLIMLIGNLAFIEFRWISSLFSRQDKSLIPGE